MTDPTPETPPPAPEEPQQAPEQRGLTGAVVRRLTWLLVGSGVLAVGGGALWGGVDFAGAVLLGFLIVLL
ncbi:MAG: hypothetical protein GWO16_03565, partial [Gammaproteobacteria bacterium]|nr:hypothetical protein [Gammaproteobacteria bacterium]NIR97178.1 hypothetical protein [Gammaproteobacteria bacterium]NIT62880.1 hypothetical protein [Gammaproteobacteria bacterium]NIV19845.1 hypothetical protein [Gammaproteobacteria bacterium]NIY31460.1 hypothetical protein [Gammaproteobacteria bacterium]